MASRGKVHKFTTEGKPRRVLRMPLAPRDYMLRVRMSLEERSMLVSLSKKTYGLDVSNTIRQLIRREHEAAIKDKKRR
jgi:hypothetical protein